MLPLFSSTGPPVSFRCPCGAEIPWTGPPRSKLGWPHDCPSETCKATWSAAWRSEDRVVDLILIRRNEYAGPLVVEVRC
jgi:hypothetical protein